MTKAQTKELDKLYSQVIRLRAKGKCEKCPRPGQNTHHIIGRRNMSTRYDLDNGLWLCVGCHVFGKNSAHENPVEFVEWLKSKHSDKWYKDLRIRGMMIVKPDYKLLKLFLIKELEKYGI